MTGSRGIFGKKGPLFGKPKHNTKESKDESDKRAKDKKAGVAGQLGVNQNKSIFGKRGLLGTIQHDASKAVHAGRNMVKNTVKRCVGAGCGQ